MSTTVRTPLLSLLLRRMKKFAVTLSIVFSSMQSFSQESFPSVCIEYLLTQVLYIGTVLFQRTVYNLSQASPLTYVLNAPLFLLSL